MTFRSMLRRPFQGNAADDVQVHAVGQFQAEPEGSARGNHGVLQADAAEIDRQVFYHISSSFLNTGPSLQTRRGPFFVWMLQP